MASSDVEALLAEIEHTDNRATYVVLADALVQCGDPRGELMEAQLALDDAPRRSDDPVATWPHSLAHRTAEDAAREERGPTLTREAGRELRLAVAALVERRAAELATELFEPIYRYGFIDRVTVSGPPYTEKLAQLFRSDEARLLRIVELAHAAEDRDELARLGSDLLALGAAPPSSLRAVVLGKLSSWWHSGYVYFSGVDEETVELASVLAAFPSVPELWIDLRREVVEWCPIVSEHLRHFTYVTPYLRRDEPAAIAQARVPNLASLVVFAGASHYVNEKYDMDDETPIYASVAAADFEPLLAMLDGCEQLRTLGICNYVGDVAALVAAIAAHPCSARLETLDLSFASAIDADALAAQLDRFAAVRTVRLEGIEIDPDSQRAIEGTARTMVGGVAVDGSPYRYVIYQE